MSKLAVRQAFETEIATFLNAQIPPVNFYQTINERQKPHDDLYCTAEYFTDYTDALCMSGKSRVENGTIDVLVFARAGRGYTAAVQLADAIEEYFYAMEINDDLQIIDTIGVNENSLGDSAAYYSVTVSLTYQYYI